jgi:drug/metabolite transporter (DMT)-like permease
LLSVLAAGLSRRAGPIRMAAIIYAGSLLVWVPLLIWYGLRGDLAAVSPAALLSVLYLAAIPSVGCNLIWFFVLRSHGASLGAISLVIQPLVGSALGVAALGDLLTPALLVGGALILGALALLAR